MGDFDGGDDWLIGFFVCIILGASLVGMSHNGFWGIMVDVGFWVWQPCMHPGFGNGKGLCAGCCYGRWWL